MILHQGSTLVDDVRLGADQVDFLVHGGVLLYYRRGAFDGDMGQCVSEVVEDGGNKYFELTWTMDALMDGDVEGGLTHPDDSRLTFVVERSEDLTTWTTDFVNSAAPEDQMDGTWLYRARSPFPVASETKTSQLVLDRPRPDPRSNPLTEVIVGGVSLALPNYPYDLPADAATLEADLVAAGFPGSTVEALSSGAYWALVTNYAGQLPASPVSQLVIDNATQPLPNYPYTIPGDEALLVSDLEDLGWTDVSLVYQGGYRIEIPDVESTGYNSANRVEWTPYLVENMLGELVNYVGTFAFASEAVNEDGIRTNVPSQFGRVRAVWTP